MTARANIATPAEVVGLPELFDEATVASYLGCVEITMRRMRKAGKISFLLVGSKPRYTADMVQQYLDASTCHAKSTASPTSTALSSARAPNAGTSSGVRTVGPNAALLALRVLNKPSTSPGS